MDAKTGQEVNEDTEAAEEWIDEYEKFRATEADEWIKELTSAANVQKVFIHQMAKITKLRNSPEFSCRCPTHFCLLLSVNSNHRLLAYNSQFTNYIRIAVDLH